MASVVVAVAALGWSASVSQAAAGAEIDISKSASTATADGRPSTQGLTEYGPPTGAVSAGNGGGTVFVVRDLRGSSGRGSRRRVVAVLVAGLVLSACGGGSGSEASDPTTAPVESTTTTAPPASTTVTTVPATTTTLAPSAATQAATLVLADIGGDWKVHTAKPTGTSSVDECVPAEARPVTAFLNGPILQKADRAQFARTTTREFASAAQAEAFARLLVTDETIECRRAAIEKVLPSPPKQYAKTFGVQRPTDGGPLTGQYAYEFDVDQGGRRVNTGTYAYHRILQRGAVVVDVLVEHGYLADDKDIKALDATVDTEVVAAEAKVVARINP